METLECGAEASSPKHFHSRHYLLGVSARFCEVEDVRGRSRQEKPRAAEGREMLAGDKDPGAEPLP